MTRRNSKQVTKNVDTLDPQVEIRKFYAWTAQVASAIQQLNSDIITLTASKVAVTVELADVNERLMKAQEEITQLRSEISRLAALPLVKRV